MADSSCRIIIDTNLWVSYLISSRLIKLDEWLESDKVKLLFSKALLEEFLEVVKRPKFRRFFPEAAINELLSLLSVKAEIR